MKRTNNSLLNEAIADAKAVKETALANAKLALQESFQPTLQRMISSKIQEEEGEEEGFDDDVHIDVNYGGEGGEMDAMPEDEGGDDIGMASFADEGGEDEMPTEEPPVEDDEDAQLEALIRELDGEESDDPMMDEGNEEDWQDPIPDDHESTVIEALIKELEGDDDMADDDTMMEGEDDGGSFTEAGPTTSLNEMKRINKKLKSDLNEAYQVVTHLKTVLNEVNLYNAKLMYFTKMTHDFQLNENQRNIVMDAIDRTNSVREAKLVYAALAKTMKKPSATKQRRVTEGLASKAIPVAKAKPQRLSEDVIRWQELANIRPLRD